MHRSNQKGSGLWARDVHTLSDLSCLPSRAWSSGPAKDVEPAPGVSGPSCLHLHSALGKSLWEASWAWKQVRTGVGGVLPVAGGRDFTQLGGKSREDPDGGQGQCAQHTHDVVRKPRL